MNISKLIKSSFLVIFLTLLVNGCSFNGEAKSGLAETAAMKDKCQILFEKSPLFDWTNKRVVVSFEDNLQNFTPVEKLGYVLSNNNLKQGITVKLKVIDFEDKSEKSNEIMIESFDLSKGVNQFTIGYNDKKPYIIY